jgi:hypothetical protein
MVLGIGKNKSVSDNAPAYTAIPSFLISPAVAAATNELSATLNRTRLQLDAEYKATENERIKLNRDYQGYDQGGVTSHGISYRSGETDMQAEMEKKLVAKNAKMVKALVHNEGVKAKQDAIQAEATAISVKMGRVKALIDIVNNGAHGPMLYDAAALLVTRTHEEQILFLNVLMKGACIKFGNEGEFETSDVRVIDSLLIANERVELVK